MIVSHDLALHQPQPGTTTARTASPQHLHLGPILPYHQLHGGDQEGEEGHTGRPTSRVSGTLASARHIVHQLMLNHKYVLFP